MRYLYLLFSLFVFSCGNLPHENLNIKLLNTSSDSYKILELENKTKNNVVFPYDTTYYGYNSLFDEKENNLFFPKIIFLDENDTEIEGLVTTSDHSHFDEEYLKKGSHLMRQEYLEKQTFSSNKMIKIKKNEKIQLKIPVKKTVFLKNPYDTLKFTIDKKTHVQIKYDINKKLARKIFTKTTLDSLELMNYKLYEGEIVSNKIPLSSISIKQTGNIEDDIAGVIDLFDQQRIKDSAGKPLVYVCDEILPIDNSLGIKEYLISKKDLYPDFNIDDYFNQKEEKVFLQKIPNKNILSAKILDDIYLKMTKREDFWGLYEKYIGKSGYWKFYLPIYNKDKTEFFLYFEESDFKMGGANRLCLFKREGNTIILKDLFLIGF